MYTPCLLNSLHCLNDGKLGHHLQEGMGIRIGAGAAAAAGFASGFAKLPKAWACDLLGCHEDRIALLESERVGNFCLLVESNTGQQLSRKAAMEVDLGNTRWIDDCHNIPRRNTPEPLE